MKSKTLHCTVFSDPGHGWLAVKASTMLKLGLQPWDFSRYSYVSDSGKTYYLEEDCDASKFCEIAQGLGYELSMSVRRSSQDSRIRSLRSIRELDVKDFAFRIALNGCHGGAFVGYTRTLSEAIATAHDLDSRRSCGCVTCYQVTRPSGEPVSFEERSKIERKLGQ